jgi:L-tyrosine isonitrile synthase
MSKRSVLRTGEMASLPLVQGVGLDNSDAGHRSPSFADSRSANKSVAKAGPDNSLVRNPQPTRVAANKILQAFNTWAFKREQPSDPELMLQILSEAMARGEPIPFVLYWGKGPRCSLDDPDIACLDYLAAFARRVQEAYERGAALKLIFTDTHAALNGHSPQSVRDYFTEVDSSARQRGFTSCWMSELTRAQAHATDGLCDDSVPEDMLRRLAASASKWYRGHGTAEQGALNYYRMNMIERRAVELAFPRSIFVTFNGSEFRGLFPQRLPIFYMYSLRRGVSVKPWFLSTDAVSQDVSSRQCIGAL